MTVWQVAAGAEGRNYERVFWKYGIACVGGPANEAAILKVKSGDIMVLKQGTSQIVRVGRVVDRGSGVAGAGDKQWLKDFDGWRLPAYCHVDWHDMTPVETKGLTRTTFQGVEQKAIRDQAQHLIETTPLKTEYEPEPEASRKIGDKAMLDGLVCEGLSPSLAEELTATVRRVRLLATYYRDAGATVSEHETRTFLVLPLLIALGWSEQQIRIEYSPPSKKGRLDVVCFNRPLHQAQVEDCALILETKGFWHGLDVAHDQAMRYAEGLPAAQSVVVTNGYCYKVYRRSGDGSFSDSPHAYLNLLRPRDKYPLDRSIGGAIEVLRLLLPRSYSPTTARP